MAIFKRLHRITIGRIEAFLDRVEDPEIIFPILIKEMEEQLSASIDAEVKASAALKQASRNLEGIKEKVEKFSRGASAALQQNDEQTARKSIEAQLDAEASLTTAQSNYDNAQDSLDHASAARKQIQQQLEDLRSKKDELLTRARVAKTQQKIQQTVGGSIGSTDSILDCVARLEANVERSEAALQIHAGIISDCSTPSLERRLGELERASEIDRRMSKLKMQLGQEKV